MCMSVRVPLWNALTSFSVLLRSCTSSYSGDRCLFVSDHTRSHVDLHEVIAISVGILMLVFALAIVIFCCVYKR